MVVPANEVPNILAKVQNRLEQHPEICPPVRSQYLRHMPGLQGTVQNVGGALLEV